MTATTGSAGEVEKVNLVTVTIDGVEVQVPAGTLVIRAAEMIGVQIPRFCDHPLLDPVGACRQCLVEIPDAGNGRAMPKPQASCTIAVAEGMVVNTQATSPVAAKAQTGNLEFLLINHPLDCPICDKGGECPLQNQSMSNGTAESRFWANGGVKRVYPKPINISPQILLDRERCVLCARCTRFSEQIAGDPFIALVERGAMQQVGTFDPQISGYSSPDDDGALTQEGQPFDSYFSGNTIQICPVGALTSADYRFRSRPFDLISSPSIAEHDACGSAIRIDHRRGKVMRRLAGDDPEVNEEWITDKDRFAFTYARSADRLTHPQVRDAETGELRAASWPEAFAVAARGLQAARAAGVLTGGRLTAEDSYAYSKFARVALGTNDIDFRARVHSDEEERFLAAKVALNRSVSFTDLETAPTVLLVAFEPEDEAGTIFLRLRKGTRRGTTKVWSVSPFTTRGLHKLHARLIPARPGDEAQIVAGLRADADLALDGSAVILVGERAAEQPGLLTAVAELADATGARLAWIPRRAGDRGAVETGALPHLFPGGRPVAEATARVDLAAAWGVDVLPSRAGRNTSQIIAAAAAGEIDALLVAGVDPADLPDPAAATAALERAFVVSLELRESAVTAVADVVFPVAPTTDRNGTFVNWEGRLRHFEAALHSPGSIPDLRVLAGIAEEMGRPTGIRTPEQAFADMTNLGPWDGVRPEFGGENAASSTPSATGAGLVLASWKQSLDDGRMQDGEKYLRETARRPVVLAARSLLEGLGIAVGDEVVLTGPRGSLSLPIGVADLAEGVVWAPATAPGASVRDHVGPAGSQVSIGLRTHTGGQQ